MINSWETLPFQKFIEVSKIKTDDEYERLKEVVSIFNNLSTDEVKNLSTDEVKNLKLKEFQNLAENVRFFETKPNFDNSNFNWKFKNLEDITTDEFISYEKLKNDDDSMSYIVSMMTGIKEEKILQLPTVDVLHAFFLLRKHLGKFIQFSAMSLLHRTIKERFQRILLRIFSMNKK